MITEEQYEKLMAGLKVDDERFAHLSNGLTLIGEQLENHQNLLRTFLKLLNLTGSQLEGIAGTGTHMIRQLADMQEELGERLRTIEGKLGGIEESLEPTLEELEDREAADIVHREIVRQVEAKFAAMTPEELAARRRRAAKESEARVKSGGRYAPVFFDDEELESEEEGQRKYHEIQERIRKLREEPIWDSNIRTMTDELRAARRESRLQEMDLKVELAKQVAKMARAELKREEARLKNKEAKRISGF